MSEPRPLSLGELLRFDRERRSREASTGTEESATPTPPEPVGLLDSKASNINSVEVDSVLASQKNMYLDSQINAPSDSQNKHLTDIYSVGNLAGQITNKPDSQALQQHQGKAGERRSSKADSTSSRIRNKSSLAIHITPDLDSQTNNLDIQPLEIDSQKLPGNDDLEIKKAKSYKKSIAKKEKEGRWTKYEKNRDRSGERGEFFCRPRNAILKRAKHLMVEHGLKTHEFFELATTMLGEYLDSQKGKPLDILISTDNDRLMRTFICNSHIINLYREVTGNRWTMTDDGVGVQFNDLDFRIVEIAMIRTYIRWLKIPSRKPIKWFKYFKDEIELHTEELKAHSANTIDVMATQARKLLHLAKQGVEVDA